MRSSAVSGPEGHPLHPFLVPLPIGAFVSSLVFDILTWTRPGELPWDPAKAGRAGTCDVERWCRGSVPHRVRLAGR
ncbi:MAG: putative rane protein [Actinomycetota bacterium]|nr:putative rane protein [Actinomycetota bacterium]